LPSALVHVKGWVMNELLAFDNRLMNEAFSSVVTIG